MPQTNFKSFMHQKIFKLQNLIAAVEERCNDWLSKETKTDLFSHNEVKKALDSVSRLPLLVAILSGVCVCVFSTICHSFGCICEKTDRFFLTLDLAGISIMIAGSSTPPLYYGFYCEEDTFNRRASLSLVWIANMASLCYVLFPYKFKSHSLQMAI